LSPLKKKCATRRVACTAAFVFSWAPFASSQAQTPGGEKVPEDTLAGLSLEELANVQVTSVSKTAERLSQAPAAIFVITHDQILRSGATNVAEALRMAPNLQVRQLTASSYAVTARGFGGNQADQNFSNKLLVLIDGRSVYSPLFSGVYFDAQDVLLEDVDRIEVISGPGATLWGANAMNGVVNIITRPAYQTTGTAAVAGAGNQEQILGARYGTQIDDQTAYRFYALGRRNEALELANGSGAGDSWWKGQGGFRADWSRANNSYTVQGDAYRAVEDQPGNPSQRISGANLLARWQHRTENSDTQLQAYVDQTQREDPAGGGGFVLHTYDIELQQSLMLGARNRLVWGAGERLNSYSITNTALSFIPASRALSLSNLFAQDTVTIGHDISLTLGLKMEDDPYSGWAPQPDARLSWMTSDTGQLWASASRAIRSPTPFDRDVSEKVGNTVFLTGNETFHPERVSAYEIGYRALPHSRVSVSASVFYNRYDDLRTVEPAPTPSLLPLYWGNAMEGSTYGAEAWADIQVLAGWRLSPGLRTLHQDLRFKPDSSRLLGVAQAGDDPSAQATLTSSMDLPRRVTWDASLRYVNALPDPALPGYYEIDTRLAWRASSSFELALVGNNLLHSRHREYPAPDGEDIVRSYMVQGRWHW
jgi:iron complex outermembrane receptor protein